MDNKRFYIAAATIAGIFAVTGAYVLQGDLHKVADMAVDDDVIEDEIFDAEFVETVEVTPDENYEFGAFCRVNYVGAKDEFVVTFGGSRAGQRVGEENYEEGHAGGPEAAGGYHYKFYTTDMEYTGENGDYVYGGGDAGTVMVDDVYYHLSGAPEGWKVTALDARNFEVLDEMIVDLDEDEQANDEMIAYANGFFILSSILSPVKQTETSPEEGYGTHNHILNENLELVDEFDLFDVEHINGSSILFLDGMYHYFTSTAYFGDLIVMLYDEDWDFVESEIIAEDSQWAQGAVYDPERDLIYLAYLRNLETKFGREKNAMLGIYDRDFNLVESIEVTDFSGEGHLNAGRPSVMMYNDVLYVSYDVSSGADDDWQCIVSVYELD